MPTWTETRGALAALAGPKLDIEELLARAPRRTKNAQPATPAGSEPAAPGVFRRRAAIARGREQRVAENFWADVERDGR